MTDGPGYLLPTVINPEGHVCIVVKLPDDKAYVDAFWGQMYELARWYTWARDDAHQGKDAAAVMWQYLTWMENCAEVGTVSECEFCCTETNELLQEILDALGDDGDGHSAVNTTLNIILQNQNTTIYNTYIADWTDVHPDLPDTTYTSDTGDGAGDVARHEIALCAAIDAYTDTIWLAHQAATKLAQEILYAVAAGAIATGAVIPGVMILLGTVLWDAIDDALFSNEDAKKLVRCCMFSSLEEAAPGNWESFRNSVLDCSFDEQSDEGLLAGLVHAANTTRVNHAHFLLHLGRAWVPVVAGELVDADKCICGETPATCWDFENGSWQGWKKAEGTVFELFEEPDSGQIFTDISGSVNGWTLGTWGSGSNLSVFVELPALTDVSHFAFRIWIAAPSIGRPYWLRFFDSDKILLHQRTGSFAGATGWYSLDENVALISDVAYIAFALETPWKHGLDVIRINEWGIDACS